MYPEIQSRERAERKTTPSKKERKEDRKSRKESERWKNEYTIEEGEIEIIIKMYVYVLSAFLALYHQQHQRR